MYVHNEMLFPDYVAMVLLIATTVFLLSCMVYGVFDVIGFGLGFTKLRLNSGLNKFNLLGELTKVVV